MAKFKNYLLKHHKETILQQHQLGRQFVQIAKQLIESDEELSNVDPYNLRKVVAKVVRIWNDEAVTTTETSEEGYVQEVKNTDAFKQYCIDNNYDIEKVKSVKVVQHTGETFYNIVMNYTPTEEAPHLNEELIQKVISRTFPEEIKPITYQVTDELLRIIITDVHIGMTTNKFGHAIYGGKWDRDELMNRLNLLLSEIYELKDLYDEIHIIDLGDYLDGWDGETVRKGHKLPQNMSNEEMFDVGIEFKQSLITRLSSWFTKVVLHNICNDNHAGDFGAITNKGVKYWSDAKFKNVEVINHRKFINHYIWNNYVFIISHGKDDKHLKFGFKPHIDDKGIKTINEYMKNNQLRDKGYDITFEKGDSHQQIFDWDCSDEFDYFNYRAFSPASEWVQTNYTRGTSGFTIMECIKGRKRINPISFRWEE